MGLNVLVTGAAGQVAQSLVEAGASRGCTVVALGRPVLDITRAESIADAVRAHAPDVIVNAAAYTAVDKAESEPDAAHLVNAIGAGNVARGARAAGVPVIHISTDYVFDGSKAEPYVETDVTEPCNVYGRSKLAGEAAVAEANPRHVIVRTSWVHSPFGGNFVKTMLRLAATHDELNLVDDQRGAPTYAPHLAAAILGIAEGLKERAADDAACGLFHASGAGETTWCGFAREVLCLSAAAGGPSARVKPILTAAYPTPARRPANSRLACDKLQQTFGLVLPDWRHGVATCVSRVLGGAA